MDRFASFCRSRRIASPFSLSGQRANRLPSHRRAGRTERLVQDDIFHLRHRTDDGVWASVPVRCKQVLKLVAERDHGVNTFRNGAKLLGILAGPCHLNKERESQLSESWKQYKTGGTAVLEGGMDYATVSMTLEDAESIAAARSRPRRFAKSCACRRPSRPATFGTATTGTAWKWRGSSSR